MAHKAPDDFGKLKKVIDTLQNGYRGKLYRAYVLRAPRTFNIVWRFAKTFLNKVTTEKVNVSKQMTNEMF